MKNKKLLLVAGIVVLAIAGYLAWQKMYVPQTEGLASGNGRIEATEVNIASKLYGQLEALYVDEGDFVEAGQVLAKIKADGLQAQLREAQAQKRQAENAILTAEAEVEMRKSDKVAMDAVVVQRATELQAAQNRLNRTKVLAQEGASSKQQLDDEQADVQRVRAALSAARAQVKNAEAAIVAAKTQVIGAQSQVEAIQATIERILVDIEDSELKSPLTARVQYRIAQPGEMVAAGGKVMNLIDLSDVYMTFFLPTSVAGKVAIGTEVRLVLDVANHVAVPARVTHVADTAQFTPKTVETASEREKLMFRVKAKVDSQLLQKYITQVKTGLPGVAWVKLDPDQPWPDFLSNKAE